MFQLRRTLCVLACVSFASPALTAAEQVIIQMHNGDQLTGLVLQQDDTVVLLEVPYAGQITLDRKAIKTVQIMQSTPEQTFNAVSNLTTEVSSDPEVPRLTRRFDLDVSASHRHGKQNSKSYSVVSSNEWRLQPWRWSLDGKFDYETKETARKTHQYELTPEIDYFYHPAVFGRMKLEFNYNYLANDYKNRNWSVGPGFSFFRDNEHIRLELMVLAGMKRADFRNSLFQNHLTFQFAALEWDHFYRFTQTQLELYTEGSMSRMITQPIPLLDFNYELSSTFGVRYWLNQQIRLSWSIDYDYTDVDLTLDGIPTIPLDVKDVRQKLSIGARF